MESILSENVKSENDELSTDNNVEVDMKHETTVTENEIIEDINISTGENELDPTLKMNIKRQIEFYFSDSNFRKDKFLKSQAELDPNGFVPISVLLTFNRLKALTTNVSLIVDAMKHSEVVDISDDGLKLKRNAELPADDNSMLKTLYVKGYPTDDPDVTIESVTAQFSTYGKVNLVHLRKIKLNKSFKGSCFIEYDQESSVADAVAAAHDGTDVIIGYKGTKFLCVLPYVEWRKRHDAKLMKRHHVKEDKSSSAVTVKLGKRDSSGEMVKDDESSADKVVEGVTPKVEFTSGLVLRINNIPSDADVFEIKDFFKNIAEIKFVDYDSGSSEAYVRTADLNASTKVQEHLQSGSSSLRGEEKGEGQGLAFVVLSGVEEQAYWEKIASNAKSGNNRGGGRGGGRGGRGRGRGSGGRSFKRGRKN
jgi:hypothetical protein